MLHQWRPHEQSLVAVQKWFCLRSVVTDTIVDQIKPLRSSGKRISCLLTKPEIILTDFSMISRTIDPCFSNCRCFVCCFLGVLCPTKLFFSLYERVKQNRSMLWNDKGSAVKFNVMLLILFLWRGRGGEIVFRCNNLEEFIRVFERRNKRHKNDVLF